MFTAGPRKKEGRYLDHPTGVSSTSRSVPQSTSSEADRFLNDLAAEFAKSSSLPNRRLPYFSLPLPPSCVPPLPGAVPPSPSQPHEGLRWPWQRPLHKDCNALVKLAGALGATAMGPSRGLTLKPSADLMAAVLQGARALAAVGQATGGTCREVTVSLDATRSYLRMQKHDFIAAFEQIFPPQAPVAERCQVIRVTVQEAFAGGNAQLCLGIFGYLDKKRDASNIYLLINAVIEQSYRQHDEVLLITLSSLLPQSQQAHDTFGRLCSLAIKRHLKKVAAHLLACDPCLFTPNSRAKLARVGKRPFNAVSGDTARYPRRDVPRFAMTESPAMEPVGKRPREKTSRPQLPLVNAQAAASQPTPFDLGLDYIPLS